MSESRRPYTGSPQPTGTPFRDHVDARPAGVARSAQLVHEGLELGHGAWIGREERVLVDRVPGLECDPVGPELREMPAHLDAVALAQPFLGDRARSDAYRRLARRRAPAAAVVAQPVFLPVRVVRVSRAKRVGQGGVVFRALILVSDQEADRGARRLPFENAGEDLDAVGFLALRHVARGAGLPAVQLLLNVGFREREPGGQPSTTPP